MANNNQCYNYINENNLFNYSCIYNINIPEKSIGIKITKQGSPYFSDVFKPVGDDMYIQTGETIPDEEPENEQRDTVAIKNGYISITPITLNRTNFEAFNALNK